MSKQDAITTEGTVRTALPNTMFRVELDNEVEILCNLSGNMRKNFIKVLPGDRVKVEMSPYDLTHGRISARL